MTDTNENCQLNIICYVPWKNSKIRTNVVPSNSRPIPQPRKWHAPARPMPSCNDGTCEDNNVPLGVPPINHDDYVSGAGFIRRRTIQNASKNAQGVWYRAAPNPIKHWRKQLFPRQGDLPGAYWNVPSERVSIRHVMDTPGGTVTLDNKDKGVLWQACNGTIPANTLTTALYLNNDIDRSSCTILNESKIGSCSQSITRRNTIFAKDYHSSSKTYLQSRARLYRQKEAIQFSRRKNKIAPASKPNMYESLYQTDQSGCFVTQDCSCIVQVAYKPRNTIFALDNAVSSSLYTKHIKYETITQNQYNVTNKWGLDGVNTFKTYPLIWPTYPGYRMPAGGTGNTIVCCHTPNKIPVAGIFEVTGGTKTIDGDYIFRTFNSSGDLEISLISGNATSTLPIYYLLVGGGGAGGGAGGTTGDWPAGGGGGGGGEVLTGTLDLIAETYSYTKGTGGTAKSWDQILEGYPDGNNGNDSSFNIITDTITARGGKYGWGVPPSSPPPPPTDPPEPASFPGGKSGNMNDGGLGAHRGNSLTASIVVSAGGGGGGASEKGYEPVINTSNPSATQRAGNGGAGIQASFPFNGTYYGGGGGGGMAWDSTVIWPVYPGLGGSGGGGGGARAVRYRGAGNSADVAGGGTNGGGGGGGAWNEPVGDPVYGVGKNGGDGILIIAYLRSYTLE